MKIAGNLTYAWICLSSFLSCLRTFMASFCLLVTAGEYIWDVNYMMVVPWILCCFNEWHFDFFSKCPICKLGNYWETGDWFSFGQWALSILDSISSGDLWGIILCISFARSFSGVPRFSHSDSCLMFQKMRVFLRFRFLVSPRSSCGGSLSDSQGPLFFYLMSQCQKYAMLSFQWFQKSETS